MADKMPIGARASSGDLVRRCRSARIATVAARNPSDRTGGTGAGLLRGASGVHCSLDEQICTVGLAGEACAGRPCADVDEPADPSVIAIVSVAPRRKVIAARRRRLRRMVRTSVDSTTRHPANAGRRHLRRPRPDRLVVSSGEIERSTRRIPSLDVPGRPT